MERRTRQWVTALVVPTGLFVLVAAFTWSQGLAAAAWITGIVTVPAWIGVMLSEDRPGRAAGMSLLVTGVLVPLAIVLFRRTVAADPSFADPITVAYFYWIAVPGMIVGGLVSAGLAAIIVGDRPTPVGTALRGAGIHRRSE